MQQHAAVLESMDRRRQARHEQMNALGYAQLVDAVGRVSVSPRRDGWQQHGQAPLMTASTSNSSNGSRPGGHGHSHARNAAPPPRQPRAFGHQGPRNVGSNGKGKERASVAAADFVAANEDRAEEERKRKLKVQAYGPVYVPEEESLRNDLGQNYLNTGRRPQNMLQGCDLEKRFKEYPKLEKLVNLHSQLVKQHACPPTYLATDLSAFDPADLLPTKFDSIIIDPPLEEYARSYPGRFTSAKPFWTWDEIAALPIPQIAANPGFIWLWVGSGKAYDNGLSGLDKGRELLAKWGYRRCEDIVWLKTNRRKPDLAEEGPTKTVLTHTKEHCLMGIRGTVRRSNDGHLVHCNVDTDVIVWDGDEEDPIRKPPELYNIIENFCLGTRRLELFGNKHNLRPGWLTVGNDQSPLPETTRKSASPGSEGTEENAATQLYDKETFDGYFATELAEEGANLVPTSAEVETLRPRSPGGANKPSTPLVPGMKSNPQGIGRHTNRAGTPSASQALEYERLQSQFQEQVIRQQQQQQQAEMERLHQEEMLRQQAAMMQQMAIMGGFGVGMGMGMPDFQGGGGMYGGSPMPSQQNQQMQMPMQWPQQPQHGGMGMHMGMQGSPMPYQQMQMPVQYGGFNGQQQPQQQQYQQFPQQSMHQGQFNAGGHGYMGQGFPGQQQY